MKVRSGLFMAAMALLVLAGPAVAAVPYLYSDNFDGAAPQNFWAFTTEAASNELWTPGGRYLDSTVYDASFGGTASIDDADANPLTGPSFVAGMLSDNTFSPIAQSDSMFLTGVINPDADNNTSEQFLVGFLNAVPGAGFNTYGMGYSPTKGDITLFAYRYDGTYMRLTKFQYPGWVEGVDFLNTPLEFRMQIQKVDETKTSIVGVAYDGATKVCELSAMAGVTVPDYPLGLTAGDVPVLGSGGCGFGGQLYQSNPQAFEASCDDFGMRAALVGDVNLDGSVSLLDLSTLAGNYGTASGMTVFDGDCNFDGAVTLTDLSILAGNYGTGVPAPVATPEPATLGLLALGVLGLLRRR